MKKLIEGFAVLGTVLGLYLLSEGNSHGFTVGALSNVLWMWHGTNIPEGGKGIILVNIILLFINLNGLEVF